MSSLQHEKAGQVEFQLSIFFLKTMNIRPWLISATQCLLKCNCWVLYWWLPVTTCRKDCKSISITHRKTELFEVIYLCRVLKKKPQDSINHCLWWSWLTCEQKFPSSIAFRINSHSRRWWVVSRLVGFLQLCNWQLSDANDFVILKAMPERNLCSQGNLSCFLIPFYFSLLYLWAEVSF